MAEVRSVMCQMAVRHGAGDADGVMALFVKDGPMNMQVGEGDLLVR